jgi:hypothetical protein
MLFFLPAGRSANSKETCMGILAAKALIPTHLPRVWEFVIDPRNMPRWVPYIESVAGVDRPLQTGDRLTQWRRDFFQHQRQELLVEEVIRTAPSGCAFCPPRAGRWMPR